MERIRVLFLCTGNSARSQMAEAFLRSYGGDRFQAFSAGLEPKEINPMTIRVMNEIGFDLDGQYSKGVDQYLGKVLFKYLITVCDQAEKNCPASWPGVNYRSHWSFEDPAAVEGTEEVRLARFREVRDQIQQKILDWLVEQNLDMQSQTTLPS
ncbi:MAG: arsenate reductase ArsC [Anaerolineaceae bacterium]|nr:arsenate reductase ArsC [Anaerolineaceae bacterium]